MPAHTNNTSGDALLLRLMLLGIIIPALLGIFTYVGFFTNFTTAVFSQAGFEQQYLHNSIYRFRILGSHLLLWVYEQIKTWPLADFAPYGLKSVDKNGDANFYYAYFLVNTAFLMATCSALVLALLRYANKKDFLHIDLPVLFLALMMSFAQFVITPYDTLSYFFLALSLLPCMKTKPTWRDDALLGTALILATLTRETAALTLSFYFAVHHRQILTKQLTPEKIRLLCLAAIFLFTYWLLRWQLGMEDATHKNFRLLRNFSNDPLPIIGAIFFPAMLALFFTDDGGKPFLKIFLWASLPYWLAMFCVAYPWEIRLWVPIFLVMTFIKLTQSPIPDAQTFSRNTSP
ncbi:MAG: hypothetical protein R3E67_04175 [Pseudomonadales bacterium]